MIRGALFPIVLAVILYYVLNPLADRLSDRWPKGAGLNRDLAIVISFALLILLVFLVLQYIIPPFAREFRQLAANAPQYISQLRAQYELLQRWEAGIFLPPAISDLAGTFLRSIFNYFAAACQQGMSGLFGLLSRAIYFVITPIVTYFLLRDDRNIAKGAVEMLPREHRDVAVRVIVKIDDVIRNYVVGQAILCTAVGLMCGLGTFLLGVKFALILGIVAGIAQLIPNIGPLIATIPALVVAVLSSTWLAASVLILYLAVNAVTIGVLAPKILGDKLNLHPMTVVISIIVFGELMGVWGFFFAAPIVATLKILYLELRNP